MKKIGYLVIALVAFLAVPFTVMAEDTTATSEVTDINVGPVNVYLFRGEGCPHCEEAIEFFDSLANEDANYFNLVKYEVWYDETNANLMKDVAKKLGDEVSGVPYIVIGDKSWNGFSSDMGEEIKKAITDLYASSDRFDAILGESSTKETNNVASVVIVVGVVAVVGLILFFGRKSTGSNEVEETELVSEETKKEVKEVKPVIEKKVAKTTKSDSKSSTKKSTTKKATTAKKTTKKSTTKKK